MNYPPKMKVSKSQLSEFNAAKTAWIFKITKDPTVKANVIWLANLIADAFNADYSGACFAKVQDIANAACVDKRTVQRALNSLINAGYLIRQCKNGHGNPNRYFMSAKVCNWASILKIEQPQNINHDTSKKCEIHSQSPVQSESEERSDTSPMSHQIKRKNQSDVTNLSYANRRNHFISSAERGNAQFFDETFPDFLSAERRPAKPPQKSANAVNSVLGLGKTKKAPASPEKNKSYCNKSERFDEFFELCFNQDDKSDAEYKYNRIIKEDMATEQKLIDAMRSYRNTLQYRNKAEWSKKASTWLFQKLWTKDPSEYATSADRSPEGRKTYNRSGRTSANIVIRNSKDRITRHNSPIIEGKYRERK